MVDPTKNHQWWWWEIFKTITIPSLEKSNHRHSIAMKNWPSLQYYQFIAGSARVASGTPGSDNDHKNVGKLCLQWIYWGRKTCSWFSTKIGKWQGSILGEFLLESSGDSYRQRHTVLWGQPSFLFRLLLKISLGSETGRWLNTTSLVLQVQPFCPENQAGEGWRGWTAS